MAPSTVLAIVAIAALFLITAGGLASYFFLRSRGRVGQAEMAVRISVWLLYIWNCALAVGASGSRLPWPLALALGVGFLVVTLNLVMSIAEQRQARWPGTLVLFLRRVITRR